MEGRQGEECNFRHDLGFLGNLSLHTDPISGQHLPANSVMQPQYPSGTSFDQQAQQHATTENCRDWGPPLHEIVQHPNGVPIQPSGLPVSQPVRGGVALDASATPQGPPAVTTLPGMMLACVHSNTCASSLGFTLLLSCSVSCCKVGIPFRKC